MRDLAGIKKLVENTRSVCVLDVLIEASSFPEIEEE